MIVLDTNVLSEPLRPRPDPRVIAWLDAQVLETLHVTTITLAELRYGIANLPAGARRTTLASALEEQVLPLLAGRILDFDVPSASAYAEVRSTARRRGESIALADALIAAVVRRHDFAIATRDTRPFLAAGLSVVDPFAG